MTQENPVRFRSLSQQVMDLLVAGIGNGTYPPGSQLPTEHQLADELDVSRATVRRAINALALQGTVVRHQGKGTFVSHIPSHIPNPLVDAIDFQELIAKHGYKPGIEFIHFAEVKLDKEMANALQLGPDDTAFESHKIFTADGDPVIFCLNTIPSTILSEDQIEQLKADCEILEPLYSFLEKQCNQHVEYHIERIIPATAADCRFHGGLSLAPDTLVIVMYGVAYNADGLPLFHTYEYHTGDRMVLELIRRRPVTI